MNTLIKHVSRNTGITLLRRGVPFLLIMAVASCGGPPQAIIGVKPPDVEIDAIEGLTTEKIFVATTRLSDSDPAIMFSGERATQLSFANVDVTIPPGHQRGNLERARTVPPDPRKHFTVQNPTVIENQRGFVAALNRELAKRPTDQRKVLVFVHGYNTTYTDAVLRLAQFANDSGFEGIPVLFTWASAGKLSRYVYDINSALMARDSLIEFSNIVVRSNAREIDLVAHSMGNLLTVEAMRQAQIEGSFDRTGRLGSIILASADIDIDLFKKQLEKFPNNDRFFVLISEDDKALATSRFIAGGVSRVGNDDVDDLASEGVVVIDLSDVNDTDTVHHNKFADSPEVVQLIGNEILRGGSLDTSRSSGAVEGLAQNLATVPGAVLRTTEDVFVVE